jgi:hypothetical protein
MPYISQSCRAKLNGRIEDLANSIVSECVEDGDEFVYAGCLNYAITRLALLVIKNLFGTGLRYWNVALLTGVFHNVNQEFYRRLASPFENKKIISNGDVDLIEDFLNDINEV